MFADEREPDTPEEETPEGAPGEPGESTPSDEGAAVVERKADRDHQE